MGRKYLPEYLIPEIHKIKGSIPKPDLPEGDYQFWLTQKGREVYLEKYRPIHDQYLQDIKEESIILPDKAQIIYQDDFQIAFTSSKQIKDKNHPYRTKIKTAD